MRRITLTSILLLGMLYSCKKLVERESIFWVSNKSDKEISFGVSKNYPDTSLPAEKMHLILVEPGQESTIGFRQDNLSDVFAELPADTMSVFIFSLDTINKYSWDSMRTRYNILKRYDVSYDDLKNNEFTVTYP